MRWPWSRPPAPPPPPPVDTTSTLSIALVLLCWTAYTLTLVMFYLGKMGRLKLNHALYAWVCPFMIIGAQLALVGQGNGSDASAFAEEFKNKELNTSTVLYLAFRIMPIAGFGCVARLSKARGLSRVHT